MLSDNMTTKTFWALVLFLLSVMIPFKARAVLEIEITKGADNARPIAIVPFKWNAVTPLPQNISQIVFDDLQRSGRFKPMPLADLPETPHRSQQVHYELWKSRGIENVVVGEITQMDANTYKVSFELLDMFSSEQGSNPVGHLKGGELVITTADESILEARSSEVNKASLRRHAHQISDIIYQKLTGIRGAFSTRLAYISSDHVSVNRYKLYVSDADGYNPSLIRSSSQPIMSPAWSPDGSKLAYVSFETGRPQIYIQNVYTGKRRSVTHYKGINGAPAWSPDGKKLSMTLSKDGNPDIYILDLASNRLTRITDHWAIDTESSWHPDGKHLIFTSDRGGKPQIYMIKLGDKNPSRVTFTGDYNAGAAFTANGEQIVLIHRENNIFHVALRDQNSGTIQPLTETQLDESPSIAPNGSMIIYATLSRGRRVLAAVSTDGRFRTILSASKGDVRAPAWSPYLN